MAYGNYCSECGGIVDNNEYDFMHGMCKECVEVQELRDMQQSKVARIMSSDCEQMRLEYICVLN